MGAAGGVENDNVVAAKLCGLHGARGGFADANKDGTITKAEFTAGAMAMFDRADSNKDGYVTADEMKAGRQAMRAAWKDRKASAQN